MGLLDQWRLKKLEKEKGPVVPPSGYSWDEIRGDTTKSDLFRQMLLVEGRKDIAQNLAKNKLENDYPDFLNQVKIFSERMVRAEKIEGFMTTESIRDIALNNSSFAEITGSLGIEKVQETVKSQLKHLAATNKDRFNLVASLIEDRESFKTGEYREIQNKVEQLLNQNKITPQEYSDALAIPDPIEKEKALKKLATNGWGKFYKTWDYITKGYLSKDAVKGLQDAGTPFEESMNKLNDVSRGIGGALFLTINENKKMREASYSNKPEEKPSGFMDAQRSANLDEEQLQKDWGAVKSRIGNYAQLLPTVKNEQKEKFLKEQKEKLKEKMRKQGGWHAFFAYLIETIFDDKGDDLKAKLE
jgi:hypothetical protein